MGRKGAQKPWPELGRTPTGLTSRAREHLGYLKTHLSDESQRGRFIALRLFLEWCEGEGLAKPSDLSLIALQRYRKAVIGRRTRADRPISASHQLQLWHAVRAFCRWLVRHGHLTHNPVASLERVPAPKRQPQAVLSALEAEVLLTRPDVTTPGGLRDRAMMEVMYSAGLRRTELVQLEVGDVNASAGTLLVREGKGKRDRLMPIGARALEWVARYFDEARAAWVKVRPNEKRLFVGERGRPLSADSLSWMVRKYLNAAGVTKAGACHLLRRTMATEMLSNGADVRVIQQILGHANLDTTTLYTRVSFDALKAVCERSHPGRVTPHASTRDNNSIEYLPSLAAKDRGDGSSKERR